MTNGTRTTDLRTRVTGSCGSGLSGFLAVRTWNGVDSPIIHPGRTIQVGPRMKPWPYISKSGKRKWKLVPLAEGEKRFITIAPKRAKRKADHNYSVVLTIHQDSPISYRYPMSSPKWYQGHTNLCGFGNSGAGPRWSPDDDYKLLAKLQNRLIGSNFNIGVFLAELPQAAGMIANSAYRISRALYFARRGEFLKAERALVSGRIPVSSLPKVAASNWLELQYGWLPLLSDAKSGAEMLACMTNTPFEQSVRVSRSIAGVLPTMGTNLAAQSIDSRERKQLIVRIKEVNPYQLSGLTDPLQIVWEKLPWSFVADWFIPIGNYLAARGVTSAVTGTYISSYKRRYEVKGLKSTNPVLELGPNVYRDFYLNFVRSVTTNPSVPLPRFKPLSSIASWRRAANAVALVTQHFH